MTGPLPVRVRLTGWYVLVLAVVLMLFLAATCGVLYWQLSKQLTRFAIEDLETVEGLLFFAPGGWVSLNEDYHNHAESRQVQERLLEVLSPQGEVLYRNHRLGGEFLGGAIFPSEGLNGYSERSFRQPSGDRILLVSRRHTMQGKPLLIRLGYSQGPIFARIEEFLAAGTIALPLLLAIAGLFGYQLAGRALFPLAQMARRAEEITADRLDQRLPVVNARDELGHLARVFNSVLDRLESSFERLRRFTSDASHELRTPLAAIRSVGEVGLQNDRSAAEYQNTIGSMLEEVSRLTKLVESLLTISQADAGQGHLTLTTFSPLELAADVASFMEVLAEERKQKIMLSGDAGVEITADRLLLRQALINILHNALKYSPAGGCISVWAGSEAAGTAIRITDSGPGIAPEHRTKIFERFYRVDSGRARETGGAGLGLSIAKWSVEAQGGRIEVEDGDSGATFVIHLPAPRG